MIARPYIKHSNCRDAFFFVDRVQFDNGRYARLKGHWMVQGVEHYWICTQRTTLSIKPDHYANWQQYKPTGKLLEL